MLPSIDLSIFLKLQILEIYIQLQNYGESDAIHKSKIDRSKIEFLFEDIELGLD